MALRIDNISIEPPTVLAPMEGITDRPFRRSIRRLGGCGLTVTEFVSSEALTRQVAKAWTMAEIDPDEHPVSIQIYGRDPERMAASARSGAELGADVIDINLGCPSKAVTSGCAGSALMREPDSARSIFAAVGAATAAAGVPFTVKMRTGWAQENRNAPEIALMAEDAGAAMVAVHGRTRCDLYKNFSDWDFIRTVKENVSVPVLVNGDILAVDDAHRALAASGADGVMVGRGILRNPWLLRQIGQSFAGETVTEPSLEERRQALLDYFHSLGAGLDGTPGRIEHITLGRIKKVTGYFTRGLPYGARLRQSIHHSHSVVDARAHVDRYFEFLQEEGVENAFLEVHAEGE